MVAIQIRDVPDDVRDVLAQAAERRGQSMQRFLLDVLNEEARRADNIRLLESQRHLIESSPQDFWEGNAAEAVRAARRDAGRE